VHRLAMVDRIVRRVMVGRMDRRVTAAGAVRPAAADTLPEVEVVIPVVVAAVTPAVVAVTPAVDITKA
jgi:hypothetical protein